MSKAKSKNDDIIEVYADEIPLDEQINKELIRHNVTDSVIAELKERYGGLKLRDVENKEDYLEIKSAKKNVRAIGIAIEKICKKGRQDAIEIQRKWLGKEKELLEKVAEVQDPLDAEIKKFEDEVQRKENLAAQKREEDYLKRQQQLLKYGATYQDGSFVLNHISYEANTIRDSDEEIFTETILPKYLKEYEKNEAERVAQEKKREEEAAALKAAQEEMERQKKELEEQQKLFKEQQDKLKMEQEQAQKAIREAEERKAAEEREKERQKIQSRINQLMQLGLSYSIQYDSYIFEDVAISRVVEIEGMDDAKWDEMIQKVTPTIERCKKELEEKRIAEIEAQKKAAAEAAAKAERERIEREQAEAKRREEEEARKKAEELEKATDKQKWNTWIDAIKQILPPTTMKSPSYKSKSQEAQKLLDKIINL